MKKLVKTLVAGVFGVSAGQAGASLSLEDEMYQATIEQNSVEAAEVFLNTYPDSKYAAEITLFVRDLIGAQHLSPSFERTDGVLAELKHSKKKKKPKAKPKRKKSKPVRKYRPKGNPWDPKNRPKRKRDKDKKGDGHY